MLLPSEEGRDSWYKKFQLYFKNTILWICEIRGNFFKNRHFANNCFESETSFAHMLLIYNCGYLLHIKFCFYQVEF